MSGNWDNPQWNWGYAEGLAHDKARDLREKLGFPEARTAFIHDVVDGRVDIEEVKLCLALRFQRAQWEGIPGGALSGQIMGLMADCKYESSAAPNGFELLYNDLRALKDTIHAETDALKGQETGSKSDNRPGNGSERLPESFSEAGDSAGQGGELMFLCAQVLAGMQFLERGL